MEEQKKVEEETPSHEEKTTYTAEEVEEIRKKMQSDSEKGVQKLIKDNKDKEELVQVITKSISKVAEDPAYLVELYESNPKVAKMILDEFKDGQSIDQYKIDIEYKEDLNNPERIEKKINQEADRRIRDRKITEKTDEFIAKLEMTPEEKDKFLEAFEERKSLKSFNVDELDKHLEKAYREISDEDSIAKLKKDEVVARAMATGDGKGSGGESKTKLDTAREEARSFLKRNGL